jgi:hypothetical protein
MLITFRTTPEGARAAPEGRMNDLYDEDILVWSEHQAELLRRRSANALDWDNLAEEIEDLGRSQLRAVESHLIQALLHELKAEAWPLSHEVPHWRAEARGQRDDARAAFTPSMAQRIDVSALYRRALRRMPETIDGQPPAPVSETCKLTLGELLAEGAAAPAGMP